MVPARRDQPFEMEYRSKQSTIASVLLAEKACDLFQEFTHFCVEKGIQRNATMDGMVAEMRSLIDRLVSINSLPLSELLRFPPLELSPNRNGFGNHPDTEQNRAPFHSLS